MNMVAARALVVEDDASWQQILGEILADAGLAVDVVGSVEAAAESLRAVPHRLAVVDLSLARGDYHNQEGLRVLDAVRRLDPGCVPIMLTGFATVELAVDVLSGYGAFSCLRKETFNRAEFRRLVDRALASAPSSRAGAGRRGDASLGGGSQEEAMTDAARAAPRSAALVVEDDAGWRGILSEVLADAGYEVRACSGFGEALGCLRRERYSLAVVDLSLEGSPPAGTGFWGRGLSDRLSGLRLLVSIRAGGTPAIVVSGVADPGEIERAYAEHGIFAFVQKQTFDRRAFLRLVEEARAGVGSGGALDVLTAREREVLGLLARGMTNKEIARELFITPNTVKRHLKAIFEKLDVHTRSAAATRAVSGGVSV